MFSSLRGLDKSDWDQTAHCRSLNLENPVVNKRPESPRKVTLDDFGPSWHRPLLTTACFLMSMIRRSLSLHVVATRLPSRLSEMDWIVSGWQLMTRTTRPLQVFQTRITWSAPAEIKIFSAVGCHSIIDTLRLCSNKVMIGWETPLLDGPSSGMYHNMTEQSSELEAITLSLNGFHFRSRTGPRWPVTRPSLTSSLPVCEHVG